MKQSTKKARVSPAVETGDEGCSRGKSVTPSGCCFHSYLLSSQCNFARCHSRTDYGGGERIDVVDASEVFLSSNMTLLGKGDQSNTNSKHSTGRVPDGGENDSGNFLCCHVAFR